MLSHSGGCEFDPRLVHDNFSIPLWFICVSLCQSIKINKSTTMQVCMHVCIHACMDRCIYVCLYACRHACMTSIAQSICEQAFSLLVSGCLRWQTWNPGLTKERQLVSFLFGIYSLCQSIKIKTNIYACIYIHMIYRFKNSRHYGSVKLDYYKVHRLFKRRNSICGINENIKKLWKLVEIIYIYIYSMHC